MRHFPLALFLVGCPAPAPAPTTPSVSVEPALETATTTCNVSNGEGSIEWTFDSSGLPLQRYENSDAAGAQWSSSWVRDEAGRTTRLAIEMLEGVGDSDQTREMHYQNGADGAVEASYERDGELHRERWFYDDSGRPTRRELIAAFDYEPRVTTCEYDDSGRVVARGDERFGYQGDRVLPSWSARGGSVSPITSFRNVVFATDPFMPWIHTSEILRHHGDCVDAFFYPCSPVFAPPPAGRPRAARLPASSRTPAATADQVVTRDLGCASSDDPEQRCTTEAVQRARSSASPELREVALVTIARSASAHESTHLLMHLSDGWWLGPQLADGPFNGNQMSGTLAFRVSDVSIQAVFEDEPGLVARYETETSNEVDERQHDVRESGLIVCVNLASARLSCARVPESIHEDIDGEVTEARVRLRIVGDGTIAVDEVDGRHQRMMRESGPVEALFD